MNTLLTIKNELQIIQDDITLSIENIGIYQEYRKKQDAENLLNTMAVWYENNLPIENVDFKLDIAIDIIINNFDLIRIQNSFTSVGKLFILHCNNGNI